jgi:hypothetical protein
LFNVVGPVVPVARQASPLTGDPLVVEAVEAATAEVTILLRSARRAPILSVWLLSTASPRL